MILTRDGKEITAIYRQDGSEIEEVKDANGRIIYSASREITGTLPISFSGRGKPLTDYLISGNAVQDGTPSSQAPVDAVGCGVRTGNLFDISTATLGKYINAQGVETNSTAPTPLQTLNHTDYIEIQPNTDYTYHYKYSASVMNTIALCWFDASKNLISRITKDINYYEKEYTLTGTSPANAAFCIINFTGYLPNKSMKLSFNAGSTALPYEPYGYKLPPTVNGTEYPIYLGQVESTRRIKKLVLTGEENWYASGSWGKENTEVYYVSIADGYNPSNYIVYVVSDHYLGVSRNEIYNSDYECAGFTGVAALTVRVSSQYGGTKENFLAYLAAQYAAGTPVTIWYVLAEPETAIVNEPLMKIGDYADTVSFAQAGVMIPTVTGTNILDMTSTVKPSEVYIKGKGIKPTNDPNFENGG